LNTGDIEQTANIEGQTAASAASLAARRITAGILLVICIAAAVFA
jgi:hypothetical protein